MTIKKLFIGVATIFFVAGNVSAADRSDDWQIRFTPYLWAMAVDGTSEIGLLPPADIDAGFDDILSNLNMALSLHTEFVKGRWTFVIDPTYVDLQIDSAISSATPQADVDLEITILLVELWSSYEVADHWELLGGLRWQSQTIDADGTVLNLPFDAEIADEDWTDFFVGVRASYDLSEKWLFTARVDAVIAGDSDSSWNGIVSFDRRFGKNDWMALNLGYRHFTDDFETGSGVDFFRWNVTQSGPFIGYTWIF